MRIINKNSGDGYMLVEFPMTVEVVAEWLVNPKTGAVVFNKDMNYNISDQVKDKVREVVFLLMKEEKLKELAKLEAQIVKIKRAG